MKIVIVYTYYNSESSNYNLSFFAKTELSYKPDVDYVIVINGHDCAIQLPELANLFVLRRPNEGYDFGGHNAALQYLSEKKKNYDYYFFMNSGVVGPILPHYMKIFDWKQVFIRKITDRVKVVGTTIVCLKEHDMGGYGPKVEGFFFLVDRTGLELLLSEGTVFCNHTDKTSAVIHGEYGVSKCMFKHGYTIDCMLTRYQGVDWSNPANWNLNWKFDKNADECVHPSRKNSFYGNSIDPYEVIFHKWFWHGNESVNYDIIKKYVDES